MNLNQNKKKHLRTIGNKLNPIIMIASKGITNAIIKEARRALFDHELIKLKFSVPDKETKKQLMLELCQLTGSEVIQSIGYIALIYKNNPKATPRLSNVKQYQ